MRAGALRHRVTIQSLGSTQDSFGESVPVWSDLLVNVAADVRPLGMREYFAAQQTQARTDLQVTMRYTSVIEPTQRLIAQTYDNLTYQIESVMNVEGRGRELTLLCARIAT